MLIVSKSSWLFLGSATSQKFNHTMDWLTPARLQPLGWPAKLFTCHQQSISLLTVSQCSCAKVFKLKWHTLCEQTKLLCSLCHLGKVLRSRPNSLRYISMFLVLLLFSTEFVSACGPGRRSTSNRRDRKLTPLVFKQHIPNVSENTLGASGLSEGRVTRNHKRFKELVPNYNADIIFKDDEGTGADRLMTQRLKEKLNTLAISVMNQWPGIKLRVTQAWHEGGQYAGDSLHYEGRAVDITTSDKDRAKLGMLARLAVEAGFEWVYYESRIWIHCSVKSEKSDAAKNGGCFDENSVVYDRNGPKLMKNLQIGDQILSMGSNGQFEYSEVVMFIDRDMTGERLYYHIETESGSTITITPSHLLFVTENNSTSDQPTIGRPRFAQDISVGQYIYTRRADNQIFLDRVIKKTTSLGRGAFAPLTTAGNLVVNNVTASCYAVIESQTLAHWAFLPVRWAHFFVQLGDRLSGYFLTKSSSSFTQRSTLAMKNSPVIQDGIHWYPRLLYKVFRYLIPSRLMYN